jgi:type IV pilus assembly protein PilY1
VYLTLGSGDRERPLITNYPYVEQLQNRFYMVLDTFSGTTINLDSTPSCRTRRPTWGARRCGHRRGQKGWFMDLTNGRGEQVVTTSVIFGGTVFFSTNRPTATADEHVREPTSVKPAATP